MRSRTHEWFVGEIKDREIEVIGVYSGRMASVEVRCEIDGHIWFPRAGNLLNGSGCPLCWKNKPKKIRKNKVVASFQDYLVVDVSTPKHPDVYMKIDPDDFERLDRRVSLDSSGYPTFRKEGELFRIHRWLIPEGESIDHINRDKLDNRRKNLRACSQKENCRNCAISKNSTTGITGISFDKRLGKWASYIMIDRNKKHLGYFDNVDFAVGARLQAEVKYFGEFAGE